MKKLLVLVGLIVAVLVMAGVIGLLFIDGIARTAIERGSRYALQVDTKLVSADVGLFDGTFHMEGFAVANPGGFESDRFLTLGSGDLRVETGSLRAEVIEIPRIALADLGVVLERREGRSNYGVIVENLRRLTADEAPAEPAPGAPQQSETRFTVDEVVISDIDVTIDFVPQGGELTQLDVAIDEVRLTDIGKGGQDPVAMAELVGMVVQAVLEAVADKGAGIVPVELLDDLQGELDRLPDLAAAGVGVAVELSEGARKAIEEGLEGAGEAAEGAGRAIQDLSQEAERALEGLVPRRGGGSDEGDAGGEDTYEGTAGSGSGGSDGE